MYLTVNALKLEHENIMVASAMNEQFNSIVSKETMIKAWNDIESENKLVIMILL
jgi:hypothetical protein